MIRNQRRHANAQVHIESVAQLARNPLHDAFALVGIFAGLFIFTYSSCHPGMRRTYAVRRDQQLRWILRFTQHGHRFEAHTKRLATFLTVLRSILRSYNSP